MGETEAQVEGPRQGAQDVNRWIDQTSGNGLEKDNVVLVDLRGKTDQKSCSSNNYLHLWTDPLDVLAPPGTVTRMTHTLDNLG